MITSAPKALSREIFSRLILSGIVKMHRYPLSAATIARPVPVLPEVGSTIVPPGFSFPSRSAASTIVIAIRSLIEPPGLRNSSFPSTVAASSGTTFWRRTSGVLPTSSSNVGYSRGMGRTLDGRFYRLWLLLRSGEEHERRDRSREGEHEQRPEGVLIAGGEGLRRGVPGLQKAIRLCGEDRGRNGDPDRAAHLLRGVEQARRKPGLVRFNLHEGGDRNRHEREG